MAKPGMRNKGAMRTAMLGGLALAAAGVVILSWSAQTRVNSLGSPRLVSIEEYPIEGDMCYRPASSESRSRNLFDEIAADSAEAQGRPANTPATIDVNRPPVRNILDTAPIFSSVGVDT